MGLFNFQKKVAVLTTTNFATLCLVAVVSGGLSVGAQPAAEEHQPAKPGIRAGSATAGKPAAGSLTLGKPAAGSLPAGKPAAGSLGGNISAGSIAPPVGQPLSTIAVPMSSIGVPADSVARGSRRLQSDDERTSRSRRSRSRN